jgi:hypothetical protein
MVNAAFGKMPLITLKKSDILKYDLFLIQKAIMLLSPLYLNHELRKQVMSSSKALEVIQKQQL